MALGIDDLYDDDDLTVPPTQNEPDNNEPPAQQYSNNDDEDDSFMLDFLKSKGIDDPDKIKFENDNGEIEERSWNDLNREEQINILNTPLPTQQTINYIDESNSLSEDEINLINSIRQSNMNPNEYLQQIAGTNVQQEPQYKIDDLSDDELYILDLESRVGELTDDEAALALSNAKQNEEFYKKQVEGIRKEYKEREDFKSAQEQAEIEQQQQEAFDQYQQSIINAIDSFNSIGNLDLNMEDVDKNDLAEFMLAQDETGSNYLYRALQDPDTLVKAAWFILNGDDAFDNISDYFTNQIKLISENQYKKGYLDGQKGNEPSRPGVVIKKQKSNPQQRKLNSIYDLYDED